MYHDTQQHKMAAKKLFTEEEVAAHDKEDDCWLVIEKDGVRRVYDTSKYLVRASLQPPPRNLQSHLAVPSRMTIQEAGSYCLMWRGRTAPKNLRTLVIRRTRGNCSKGYTLEI